MAKAPPAGAAHARIMARPVRPGFPATIHVGMLARARQTPVGEPTSAGASLD